MISAEIICDSISPQGKRVTTFKLRYPKFIHGEFMTHRVISRNASSSRAIPTKKLLEEVRSDVLRAAPVFWGANQKGMQAVVAGETSVPLNLMLYPEEGKTYDGDYSIYTIPHQGCVIGNVEVSVQEAWREAALRAADVAEAMDVAGYHKQIVNRLLEPFSHINVIATATEWENFFGLRLHKDAQPEMRALALAMWEARQASKPNLLRPGQWHLPFIDDSIPWTTGVSSLLEEQKKVSVARCARVSYESFETGKRSTIEEDLRLYDRLLGAQPLHASPAEHQATPDTQGQTELMAKFDRWDHRFQWGNFVGWRQYRKMLPNEAVAPLPEGF